MPSRFSLRTLIVVMLLGGLASASVLAAMLIRAHSLEGRGNLNLAALTNGIRQPPFQEVTFQTATGQAIVLNEAKRRRFNESLLGAEAASFNSENSLEQQLPIQVWMTFADGSSVKTLIYADRDGKSASILVPSLERAYHPFDAGSHAVSFRLPENLFSF